MKKFVAFWLMWIPVIPLVIIPQLPYPYISSKVLVFRLIILIIAFPTLYLEWKRRREYPRISLSMPLCLFIASAIISTLFSIKPSLSLWSNWQRYNGLIELLYLCIMYLAMVNVMNADRWKRFVTIALGISTSICIDAIIHRLFNLGADFFTFSTMGNPIYLGAYALICYFLCLHALPKKWWSIPVQFIHLGALAASDSRGAFLGLCAGLLYVSCKVFTRRGIVAAMATIVSCIGILIFWHPRYALGALFSNSRFVFWDVALKAWWEKPIFGWGMETYRYAYDLLGEGRLTYIQAIPDKPHNMLLDHLVAGGLLQFSTYVALVYYVMRDTFRTRQHLMGGALIAYLVQDLFLFDILVTYLFFFSLIAYTTLKSQSKAY